MNEMMVAGIPLEDLWEYRGEPFSINTTFRVRLIQKVYRFVVTKRNSWRMVIPSKIVEEMGIDRNTHYLLFYSRDPDYLVFFFFTFSEVMRVLEFSLPIQNKKPKKEKIPQGGREGIIYNLSVNGMLMNALMKVWSSRARDRLIHGITVPKDIVEKMDINPSTLFMVLYSPETNVLILELKNLAGGKRAEKAPYKEKEDEEEVSM